MISPTPLCSGDPYDSDSRFQQQQQGVSRITPISAILFLSLYLVGGQAHGGAYSCEEGLREGS